MRDKRYKLEASALYTTYEFISDGPKGQIEKLVKYTETGVKDFYNLGFGDKIGNTDDFNDTVISNNNDSMKVLATVASTIYMFTNAYPESKVFVTGSTPSRIRLYRISISSYLEDIEKDFSIFGYLNKEWMIFEKNQDYQAFLITRRELCSIR
jgi:hypothetical protein